MKVLIISSNRHSQRVAPIPAFPSGPAYIAGAALEAGHEVQIFDACFAEDLVAELSGHIGRFGPDVIGVSIRNLSNSRRKNAIDLRPSLKEITDCAKRASSAPIVLGGPGFRNWGPELLEYLDLGYGIRGEGEIAFPQYLRILEESGDVRTIPGCIFREDGEIKELPPEPILDLDATPFPVFGLFDLDKYRSVGGMPLIVTKRGCAFQCTYCPQSKLEGPRYRLKSPGRVVDEIERANRELGIDMFYFGDNLFNFPKRHAESICRELISRGLGVNWTLDSLSPLGLTKDFCRLMKEAGCVFPCLAVESGSARMLKRMKRGYGPEEVKAAIINLHSVGIPFIITLLLGGPGETPETISETIGLIDSLPKAQLTLVTIGLMLEHNQEILADAIRDSQLEDESAVWNGRSYLSPTLTDDYVEDLYDSLRARENWEVW